MMVVFLDISLVLKISHAIRQRVIQLHSQQQPQPSINMQRYKKSAKTMYYILGVFLVCFLPSLGFFLVDDGLRAAGINMGAERYYAFYFAIMIVLLNSALNPLIYCWRIQEIRKALTQMLRRQ